MDPKGKNGIRRFPPTLCIPVHLKNDAVTLIIGHIHMVFYIGACRQLAKIKLPLSLPGFDHFRKITAHATITA
jgi:hypothetical protein